VSRLPPLALVVLISILSGSKSLRADSLAQLAIQWEAPLECPNRAALIDELRRDLERSQAPSVRLAVVARVERPRPDAWQVTIMSESAEGISERVVNSKTCPALLDATSLIIAMMIDPETAANHARPTDDSPQAPAVTDAPKSNSIEFQNRIAAGFAPNGPLPIALPHGSPASLTLEARAFTQVDSSAQSQSAWSLAGTFAATTALDYGSLPGFSGVIRGSLGLLYGPIRFETSLGYWIPKNYVASPSELPGVGGEFGKVSLLGRVCANVWQSSTFAVGPCVGLGAAWFSGSANRIVPEPAGATVLKSEPDVGAIALLRLTNRFALRLDLDVAVPLNRPEFGYKSGDAQKSLYAPAPASVRTGIGLELKVGN